ncbi:RNA-dependent DNA polymerase [Pleurocapsa sp. CCALA 161]|uniref:group II intron reverse transcriptase/maturase n=1 Tax=Pleurocapsa sp. CCALA 161 TaxID=2107688 RepID=UPI000D081F55|nr:reverse transcriptase domain-containing protein [Pleurocapsa sp. CCALA 161]PSB05407.1 RNA-dependent DNA polymerase [Pleurocapsa sp. CCALA 161]
MTQPPASDKWKQLPWKKFQRIVFRLQRRIWKAQKAHNYRLVRQLQKLLLRSQAAKFLAVRQVTQLNKGRKTAGVDGIKSLPPKQRLNLVFELDVNQWQHQFLRRVWIPKSKVERRGLGIPTIADRAHQSLLKIALEPATEAYFSAASYGFRPGRSTLDVQKKLFHNLRSQSHGITKSILEMDIEKCFDQINHRFLMSQISLPPQAKQALWKALKAGVQTEFPTSKQGTPQGGCISPLLANIALHGLADLGTGYRYADDCVFILKPTENPEKLRHKIDEFLAIRGLRVKEAKTKLVTATEGFDFLGWHFRVKGNGKFISTPSDKNYSRIQENIKTTLKNSKFKLEARINKVCLMVRGWRNYHKHCDMNDHNLWFVRYWSWKFIRQQGRFNRRETDQQIDRAFPSVSWSVNKFVNVTGTKSPFDGDLAYWSQRKSNQYNGHTVRALKRQGYKCGECSLAFLPEDKVELHHIDGNHHNWKNLNLVALHRECHQGQEVHSSSRQQKVKS